MSKQAWDAFRSFKEGHLPQASNKYQQIFEQEPSNVSAVNMLAEIATRQGQWVEALRYYRQAIRLPSESEVKSETLRKKMIRLDPDSVEDKAVESASTAPVSDSVQASLDKLKVTIAADPKNLENYQKLGELLEQNGRQKEAAEQWLVVGNALFNNKAYKKAGEIFKRIVGLDNACLPAHLALGEIYSKEGSDSDAKKEFLFVAEHLIRQGNLEKGQVFAQKAIQLKSIEAHYYLGLIYLSNHQAEEARKEFETLLKFKVNHQSGLTQLAALLSELKQWDEAVKLYERLLKIDPRNAYASERIAAIALQMNQPNLAEEKFVQAMESHAANEDWELAAYCALEAVRLDQPNQELYLKLADAAYNAGLESQAAEACLALADLLEAEGKSDEAQNLRNKAHELQSGGKVEPASPPPTVVREKTAQPPAQEDVSVMLNVADTYIQQGALDEAIEIYQKIIKREPNNQQVRTALTRVYARFAGLNPETAVARKSQPAAAAPSREPEEKRVQREARERAIREAQVRSQRTTAPDAAGAAGAASAKPAAKEDEWLQNVGNARGDEIAGDHQDEFMTVTVAEIYTKQGLLNEALKIYQKILEIEPGNMEAQVKKQQLEKKVAEQEKIRQQTQDAQAAPKPGTKDPGQKETPAAEAPPKAPPKPAPTKEENGGEEPPAGRGKRGRVSYV